jgi:hypothetical protein
LPNSLAPRLSRATSLTLLKNRFWIGGRPTQFETTCEIHPVLGDYLAGYNTKAANQAGGMKARMPQIVFMADKPKSQPQENEKHARRNPIKKTT